MYCFRILLYNYDTQYNRHIGMWYIAIYTKYFQHKNKHAYPNQKLKWNKVKTNIIQWCINFRACSKRMYTKLLELSREENFAIWFINQLYNHKNHLRLKKIHQRNNELYFGLKCKHTASENCYKYRKRS